jgi:molybdopterin-guanine dinucleotide biosynthesis protein A
MLDAGEHRLRLLFERVRTRTISQSELEVGGCTARHFAGVNTQEEWDAARARRGEGRAWP